MTEFTKQFPRKRKLRVEVAPLGARLAIGVVAVTILAAIMAPSHGVVLAAGFSLAGILALLWRSNEPPLLLFPILYQWSEVAVKPILSIVQGVPVNELADYSGNIELAAYFGFSAMFFIAVGIRLTSGSLTKNWGSVLSNEAGGLSLNKMLSITILMIFIGQLFYVMSGIFGTVRQILLNMSYIGFVGMFLLCYWCIKNNRGYFYMIIIMFTEIIIGFTGYFSDFKGPVLILAMAALSARTRMRAADIILIILIATLVIFLGSFWSNIKKEYREFSTAGSEQQGTSVSFEKRIGYVEDQIFSFNEARFNDGLTRLLSRHSYVDFLSLTMDYVPRVLPHENGKRIGSSIIHIITPRMLFPDKPETESDTVVTVKYTGLPITLRTNLSISIGYLGELYIDWGVPGALAACLFIGASFGAGYRYIVEKSKGPVLLRFGLCAVMALVFGSFGTALIKFIGGGVTAFISVVLIEKFVNPRLVKLVNWRPLPRLHGPGIKAIA